MKAPPHICRHCDEPIADPADVVEVAYEGGVSGPGRAIYAHRDHARLVKPDPVLVSVLARVALRQAGREDAGGQASLST
ncbi:hypothetical protein [Streptomyces scabiei]|jgi:hypothetical protein|uniref:hypothetical protein n=1 Tax=Streptomyces scabiei TaxID=1930 RepID=UPI001B314EF1|nr:hypothetical protein [Streptomyces sp. LBUM 1475]QTU64200.1 hypothetical protein F3K22_27160 [Streptomyces sp. LBUM 1475]